MDAIEQLAKDAGIDPQKAKEFAKANNLPAKLPPAIAERAARIKAEKIRRAAGMVC